jgi:hypothetical protein
MCIVWSILLKNNIVIMHDIQKVCVFIYNL